MAWSERRGVTFALGGSLGAEARSQSAADARGRERFVRLSLLERGGLGRGWFNVREARAEPRGAGIVAIAEGRLLSWRWLRLVEAQKLWSERQRTLAALGYDVVEVDMVTRGRWDWLHDLVRRGLPGRTSTGSDAVTDALARLGLTADEVLDGIASLWGIRADELRDPTPEVAARVPADRLAAVLPSLFAHVEQAVRRVAPRWLALPVVAYQLPPALIERWLREGHDATIAIVDRLTSEGLALLGPEALVRLSSAASDPAARQAARAWVERLEG